VLARREHGEGLLDMEGDRRQQVDGVAGIGVQEVLQAGKPLPDCIGFSCLGDNWGSSPNAPTIYLSESAY